MANGLVSVAGSEFDSVHANPVQKKSRHLGAAQELTGGVKQSGKSAARGSGEPETR